MEPSGVDLRSPAEKERELQRAIDQVVFALEYVPEEENPDDNFYYKRGGSQSRLVLQKPHPVFLRNLAVIETVQPEFHSFAQEIDEPEESVIVLPDGRSVYFLVDEDFGGDRWDTGLVLLSPEETQVVLGNMLSDLQEMETELHNNLTTVKRRRKSLEDYCQIEGLPVSNLLPLPDSGTILEL